MSSSGNDVDKTICTTVMGTSVGALNNIKLFKDFLGSYEGLTFSCFVAGMSTLSQSHVIANPTSSVFGGIIGAVITSGIFNFFTPISIRLYASSCILGLSFIRLICNTFRKDPPNSSTSLKSPKYTDTLFGPLIYINYKKSNLNDSNSLLYRVSYTSHKILNNNGPTIEIDENLTSENILSLIKTPENYNIVMIRNIEIIRNVLELINVHPMKGIFIHDATNGYIMITSKANDNNVVVSIRID
jgi:hypothetical protein